MRLAIVPRSSALFSASLLRAEVVTTRTNVFTGASQTAPIAYKLSRGEEVRVDDVCDGWARISELGLENSHWVMERHLAERLSILCCRASERQAGVRRLPGRIVFENPQAFDDEQTSPDPPDCR